MAIILGGGLTGLSIAYRLAKRGIQSILFEEKSKVGGLASSFNFENFTFDKGPHVFRANDQKLLSFISSLTNSHLIHSDPKIWKGGVLHDSVTPVISLRNLSLLPEETRKKALEEYSKIKNARKMNANPKNFEESLKNQVGETLYEEYFKTFSEKWWGCPPKQLSAKFAPSNLSIGKKAYYGHISASYQLYIKEIYPAHGGIGVIADELAKKVSKLGVKILKNSRVKNLVTDGDAIKSVIIEQDNSEIEYEGDIIFSTIPLTELTRMLKINCNLSYRSLICIFLKINRKQVFRNKWLYFHDKEILFGRISEPKLFSELNSPPSITSLCVEITCQKDDHVWNSKYLSDAIIQELHDLNIAKKKEISIIGIQKMPYAYPLYKIGYEKELNKIKEEIPRFQKLHIVGRTGSFAYTNMESAIKKGIV